jgi:Trypsin
MRRPSVLASVAGALAVTLLTVPTGARSADGGGASGARHAQPAAADPAVADLAADRQVSLAEAAKRIGWQRHAPKLAKDLTAALGRGVFGGMWIGEQDDRVKVGVVGEVTEHKGVVDKLAVAHALSGVVDAVPVRYSAADLDATGSWLADQLVRVNRRSSWPLLSATFQRRNVVEFRLPPDDTKLTAGQQELVRSARNRYGAMLRIERYRQPPRLAACLVALCDPPLRGGIQLNVPLTHGGYTQGYCTGGFLARSRSDNKLYLMTAGHCGYYHQPYQNDPWWQYFYNGERHDIGPMHHWVFDTSGDAAIVAVDNETGWRPRAWVYVESWTGLPGVGGTIRNPEYPIYDDGSGLPEGTRLCKTGATTITNCGLITRLDVTVSYRDKLNPEVFHTVKHLGQANFCVKEGDSGGPVYAVNVAYGLVSGFQSNILECISFYQGVRAAKILLGVNVSHDAG